MFGLPAQGIIGEFERAKNEIMVTPHMGQFWGPILAKYTPSMYQECCNAVEWCKQMVKQWLITGMFAGEADAEAKADEVLNQLRDQALTLSHSRHISIDRARDASLKVKAPPPEWRWLRLVDCKSTSRVVAY